MIPVLHLFPDASCTTELQAETDLARKPVVILLQMLTRLQEVIGSREILVTLGRELVSVDEVLEAVLSTVGATRVPEIADLLVKIPSDVDVDVDIKISSDERRGVVNLIDVLIADSIEIEGTVSLIGKLSMKRKMFK